MEAPSQELTSWWLASVTKTRKVKPATAQAMGKRFHTCAGFRGEGKFLPEPNEKDVMRDVVRFKEGLQAPVLVDAVADVLVTESIA
jgi:hypothetical protein